MGFSARTKRDYASRYSSRHMKSWYKKQRTEKKAGKYDWQVIA